MSSAVALRVLVALLVCASAWLAVAGTSSAQGARGIDPNQGLSLVEVNLPSKVAAMRLQVRAHRYKVEFNEHYLRRNGDGSVTATVRPSPAAVSQEPANPSPRSRRSRSLVALAHRSVRSRACACSLRTS